jgi:cytoskeletal protein CcmA (bactofilin family)
LLTIEKEGNVNAKANVKDAVISGHFKGDIIASGSVGITSSGRFVGNLTQENAMLSVKKGGLFKGKSIIARKKIYRKKPQYN